MAAVTLVLSTPGAATAAAPETAATRIEDRASQPAPGENPELIARMFDAVAQRAATALDDLWPASDARAAGGDHRMSIREQVDAELARDLDNAKAPQLMSRGERLADQLDPFARRYDELHRLARNAAQELREGTGTWTLDDAEARTLELVELDRETAAAGAPRSVASWREDVRTALAVPPLLPTAVYPWMLIVGAGVTTLVKRMRNARRGRARSATGRERKPAVGVAIWIALATVSAHLIAGAWVEYSDTLARLADHGIGDFTGPRFDVVRSPAGLAAGLSLITWMGAAAFVFRGAKLGAEAGDRWLVVGTSLMAGGAAGTALDAADGWTIGYIPLGPLGLVGFGRAASVVGVTIVLVRLVVHGSRSVRQSRKRTGRADAVVPADAAFADGDEYQHLWLARQAESRGKTTEAHAHYVAALDRWQQDGLNDLDMRKAINGEHRTGALFERQARDAIAHVGSIFERWFAAAPELLAEYRDVVARMDIDLRFHAGGPGESIPDRDKPSFRVGPGAWQVNGWITPVARAYGVRLSAARRRELQTLSLVAHELGHVMSHAYERRVGGRQFRLGLDLWTTAVVDPLVDHTTRVDGVVRSEEERFAHSIRFAVLAHVLAREEPVVADTARLMHDLAEERHARTPAGSTGSSMVRQRSAGYRNSYDEAKFRQVVAAMAARTGPEDARPSAYQRELPPIVNLAKLRDHAPAALHELARLLRMELAIGLEWRRSRDGIDHRLWRVLLAWTAGRVAPWLIDGIWRRFAPAWSSPENPLSAAAGLGMVRAEIAGRIRVRRTVRIAATFGLVVAVVTRAAAPLWPRDDRVMDEPLADLAAWLADGLLSQTPQEIGLHATLVVVTAGYVVHRAVVRRKRRLDAEADAQWETRLISPATPSSGWSRPRRRCPARFSGRSAGGAATCGARAASSATATQRRRTRATSRRSTGAGSDCAPRAARSTASAERARRSSARSTRRSRSSGTCSASGSAVRRRDCWPSTAGSSSACRSTSVTAPSGASAEFKAGSKRPRLSVGPSTGTPTDWIVAIARFHGISLTDEGVVGCRRCRSSRTSWDTH